MQGTLGANIKDSGGLRLIPAHAGNTCSPGCHRQDSWAHPRACGEHRPWEVPSWQLPGSSPRMRGTRRAYIFDGKTLGLIPAHAGNTDCFPRGRLAGGGSSPRMRGTPDERLQGAGAEGLIPAHAGNTVALHALYLPAEAHPRACGEHCSGVKRSKPRQGSSPRMRGTRVSSSSTVSARGLIPAHAGNTPPSNSPSK